MYEMVATFNFRVSVSTDRISGEYVVFRVQECKEELDGLKQLEDLVELQR